MEFMELQVQTVSQPGRQPFVSLLWKATLEKFKSLMGLERLSCLKDFEITYAQTNVSFFYLNPLLQVEFRAIFEPFSYILLNGSKCNTILSCI